VKSAIPWENHPAGDPASRAYEANE
jgi:hypothetical protein